MGSRCILLRCANFRAFFANTFEFSPDEANETREFHNKHFTMAGDQQQFCLRWNDFQTNMVSSFKHLRDEKSFTDVTLACDGQTCKAHKMVLSARSPYFKSLLEENPAKHPIIILKDVPFNHLTAILEFMYAGEVNVAQDQLPAFLKTAERLKVKGLAEAPQTIKQE